MWLNKYPDGGTVPKPKAKVQKIGGKSDPLRPQGLGVQVQDNLRPMPLVDVKAVSDSNTDGAKIERNLIRQKQQAVTNNLAKEELARRKALIDKSNKEGGFKNSAVAEKLRVFPNSAGGWGEVFDDYVNLPRVLIGQSADALGHAKSPSEFAQAIATPLAIGAMGYSPLHTARNAAVSIAENPIVQTVAGMPKKLYNTYNFKNELKEFNAGQQTAPLVDDATYGTLRSINKAGNLYSNGTIPLDQRIDKMLSLNIPEEQIIRLTGKTRQELVEDAAQFSNIKKTALETNTPVNTNGTIDLTRRRNYTDQELQAARRQQEIDNMSASQQEEYFRRVRIDAEQRNRVLNNVGQGLPSGINYNVNNFAEEYASYTVPTNRMNQMQKANNINEKLDGFLGDIKSKQFSKQYIPGLPEGAEVKDLIPSISRSLTNNAEQRIKESASAFSSANKGEYFRGASSLSDGSFPAYLQNIQREVKKGVGEPIFGGYEQLNSMGFLKNSGIADEEITGYLNKYIMDFNKATGKNLPKARIYDGQIKYPDIVLRKLEEGGTIKNWLNKY